MSQQQIVAKVGELAERVGYPVPTVNWVPAVAGQHSILLQDDGRTLVVHDRVDDEYSEQERELLIAQELIQARLGGPRQRRWIKTAESGVGGGAGVVAALLIRQEVSSTWLACLLALGCAYVFWTAFHAVLGATWTRLFTRRADRALADVIGRDRVVAWLRAIADNPSKPSAVVQARWILDGAPPRAAERLRMFGEKP
ncbi:hypothetical protein AB0P21_21530 [Kribbella sp. NPDC056861]|uniref:hypothetical protein n=1 Tax=Kribbella sp. NPDC056861 TaxID=3154857 RepID=UPI0034244C05